MAGVRGESSGRTHRLAVAAAASALLFAGAAMPATAGADRGASTHDKRAIKRAFLKRRDVQTHVRRVRISTVDRDYAAVKYSVELPPASAPRGAEGTRAPTPALLKERRTGKWKVVSKAPRKVRKDLGAKSRSDIVITGDVVDVLRRPAPCSMSRDYYGAGIYDPGDDVYLSIEMPGFHGPGMYPALGVKSLGSLSVGNSGGEPQYVTGQSSDAFSPSGVIYVDRDGWGLIDAGLARYPDSSGNPPISVDARGYWVCR